MYVPCLKVLPARYPIGRVFACPIASLPVQKAQIRAGYGREYPPAEASWSWLKPERGRCGVFEAAQAIAAAR